MKTTLLIITLFAFSSISFGQENKDTSIVQIVDFPDVEAEFPGGNGALMKYISQNIIYPEDYLELDITGTIYLSFFVNTNGYVSDVKVERGLNKGFDAMAKKLIRSMPPWKPAKMNEMAVKSRVRLPIAISLE
jgi:protein TonB